MKNSLLPILFLFISMKSVAQSDHPLLDTRFGVGVVTAPEVFETIGSSIAEALVSPDFESLDITNGGIALQGSILFMPESRIGVGADFVYDSNDILYLFTDSTQSTRVTYTSVLGRLDLRYKKEGMFRIYSSVGFGISQRVAERTDMNNNEREKNIGYAMQITPIGVRLGGRLAVWAEAGFGFRGLLSGGVSFQW
ncbi:MAG: hypothetical protein ACKOA1_02180 [Bacteroidota bacterium]